MLVKLGTDRSLLVKDKTYVLGAHQWDGYVIAVYRESEGQATWFETTQEHVAIERCQWSIPFDVELTPEPIAGYVVTEELLKELTDRIEKLEVRLKQVMSDDLILKELVRKLEQKVRDEMVRMDFLRKNLGLSMPGRAEMEKKVDW
jgi:hypothetical protein